MTAVLLIGVAPKFVDPHDPAIPVGTTPQSIAAGIEKGLGRHASARVDGGILRNRP